MAFRRLRARPLIDAKTPRFCAALAFGVALLTGAAPSASLASDANAPREGNPAVSAANLRLGVEYEYFHIDSTETTVTGTTLRIPNLDGHSGRAELVGTFPVYGPIGGRVLGRVRYGHTQRNLDSLDRGNNEVTSYGAGAELFVRDPGLGSFTLGAGYDRHEGDGSVTANRYSGTARAAIFFPDLGSGPVDWVVSFEFAHQRVSGVPGPVEIDSDRYAVTGSAGWYLTDDFQFVLGGRWERAEEEFSSEDDREAFAMLRWRVPAPVSIELNLGGFGGLSDYKQSPFRSDHRPIYGASGGVVFRFGSGATLLDSVRRFD